MQRVSTCDRCSRPDTVGLCGDCKPLVGIDVSPPIEF
jgi:hypothetical protein